jgi:hypothetical protein
MTKPNKQPVLFLVFNRLEKTKQVLESIQEYQPDRIYIASDGPRNNEEADIVNKVREYIVSNIDWDCTVEKLFRERNLGSGLAVSGAISWFFEKEKMGIILEDDCLPSNDFFKFCEIMLIRYEHNSEIIQINGFNPFGSKIISNNYGFTYYPRIWGWATWDSAWKTFDFKMENWPKYRNKFLPFRKLPIIEALIRTLVWNGYYLELKSGKAPRAWDYQWTMPIFLTKKLCIYPEVNLVKNIGMGIDATNCLDGSNPYQFIDYGKLEFPLVEKQEIKANKDYNRKAYLDYKKERFTNFIKRFKK